MADIQVDPQKLKDFATAIHKLLGEITIPKLNVHPKGDAVTLLSDTYALRPNVGQDSGKANVDFPKAVALYNAYDNARTHIIGDDTPAPAGSFTDFRNQLTILESMAGYIADTYEKASNKTTADAGLVAAALNSVVSQQPAGQG